MNWECRPSRGVRSTRLSWLAHGLCGPSPAPGTTSNGSSQEALTASALASTSSFPEGTSTGNCPMIPPVRRRAQSSSAAWPGNSPVSTARGSPASHRASPSVRGTARCHTPAAAATAGCGADSRPAATAAA